MFIDFAAAVILIICIIIGERRGVIESFASAFGWLFSLFFSLLYSPSLADFLTEKTGLKSTISDFAVQHVKGLISGGADTGQTAASGLPDAVSRALANSANSALETAARPVADNLADIFISVIAFLAVLFLVKFVIHFLERLIRGFHKAKSVGTVDGILGMVFGILKGGVLIYLLISLLLLVAAATSYEPLTTAISSSVCVDFLNSHDLLFFGGEIADGIKLPEVSV